MFDRFKPAIYITGFIWGLLLLLYILTPKGKTSNERDPYARMRGKPTYQVWDIQVLEAESEVGKTFRVPIIINSPFEDSTAEETGFVRAADSDSIAVGQSKEIETTYLEFRPIEGAQTQIRPLNFGRMKAKLTLLKACEVEMTEVTETKVVNTGYGVIAVPKLKKVKVRKASDPPCKEPSDLQADVSVAAQELPPAVVEAKKHAEAEEVKRRLYRARQDRARIIVSGWKKDAGALGPAKTTLLLKPDSKPFLKDVCSRFAALMRVLEVRELVSGRNLKTRTQHQGYSSEVWESSLSLIDKSGKRFDLPNPMGLQSPFLFSSLKIDDTACVAAAPPKTEMIGYETESKSLKEIESLFERYMDSLASAQAESEIPMPREEAAPAPAGTP